MTGMERVLAALRGEPADRRAFTLALSLYGSRLSKCPTKEYFSDPRRYLEGQREVARRVGIDAEDARKEGGNLRGLLDHHRVHRAARRWRPVRASRRRAA